jgi:hypothetical protein
MINTPVDVLSPPLTEAQIIHKLIAQYLAHDGYIETARAFAAEVRQEHQSLVIGTSDAINAQDLEPVEDVHAIHRQSRFPSIHVKRFRCLPWMQKYVQPS